MAASSSARRGANTPPSSTASASRPASVISRQAREGDDSCAVEVLLLSRGV
jgi:hypothetical protein